MSSERSDITRRGGGPWSCLVVIRMIAALVVVGGAPVRVLVMPAIDVKGVFTLVKLLQIVRLGSPGELALVILIICIRWESNRD